MSARGEYRSIYTVLLDGPDFQALRSDARLVFYTIKFSLGLSGIDVLYSEQIERRSGLSRRSASRAVAELVETAWMEQDGNLVWNIRGLEFEPNLQITNRNHRVAIAQHLQQLPRRPIVERFRGRYKEWLVDAAPLPVPPSHDNGPAKARSRHRRGSGIPLEAVVSSKERVESTSARARASTATPLASRGGFGFGKTGSQPGERAIPPAPPLSAAEHAVALRRGKDDGLEWWGRMWREAMAAGATDVIQYAYSRRNEPADVPYAAPPLKAVS